MGTEGRRGEGEVVEAGEGLWAAFSVLLPSLYGSMGVAAKLGGIFKIYLMFDTYITCDIYGSYAT